MGVRVKVTCRACKSEWDCRTGCGVMHGRLEKVAGLYPDGIQKAIMERVAQMEFPVYDFGYRLARCERCRAVVSIPALSFGSDGVEYAGTCAGNLLSGKGICNRYNAKVYQFVQRIGAV